MALSDWLGGSRRDGFAYHLQLVASRLGLTGEIIDGVGYYQVWGRCAMHPLIISLDQCVWIRILSNVRFPPGRIPQNAVLMVMERHDANRLYGWDVHNNPRWSCFYILTRIDLESFGISFLQRILEETLAEVGSLDDMLTNRNHLSNPLPVSRPPILPHVSPPMISSNDTDDYITQLANRFLKGPRG